MGKKQAKGNKIDGKENSSGLPLPDLPQSTSRVSPLDNSHHHLPGLPGQPNTSSGMQRSEMLSLPIPSSTWAQPVCKLWQCQEEDNQSVKQFNRKMSLRRPFCSVCTLFERFDVESEWLSLDDQTSSTAPPLRSLPMIPEASFAISQTNKMPFCDYNPLDEDGLSPLLVCSVCSVTVHASCYGDMSLNAPEHWTCDACNSSNSHSGNVVCSLCCLRGGALKPTSDGKWAHIVCALAISDVSFQNVRARAPINTLRIDPERFKLKCSLCGPLSEHISHPTACVQCSHGRCTKAFHVSCAIMAGIKFEISDWPVPIYISCLKHVSSPVRSDGRQTYDLSDLQVNDLALAKHHRNRRYYWARVTHVVRNRLYEVDFDDGSFSEDLLPEDIESRDCLKDGPPTKGEHVSIKWTDGDLYGATFRRVNVKDLYTVEFEDGSQLQARRDELWSKDDEIPRHIRNRMSEATPQRFDLFEEESQDGKRAKKKVDYLKMLSNTGNDA